MISQNYDSLFSWNILPRSEIRQFHMYQIRTVNIKKGSFFRYHFHISCIS